MGFAASKIVWVLLAPLNFILVLLLAGVGLLFAGFRRAGLAGLSAGLALFIVLGVFPAGPLLLAQLEKGYERPAALPGRIDGIIVLGGVFDMKRGTLSINEAAERVVEGVSLARRHPSAKLVFSGGEGRVVAKGHPESLDTAAFLEMIGFRGGDRLIYEDRSRNTYENVRYSQELLKPQAGERWVVVTSAWHMKRAMALFEKAGWPGEVVAWPADYRTTGQENLLPRKLDVGGNFYHLDVALHEYAGLLYYRLTGKI